MRKAQMEIFGLIIIVILFIVILLFFVSFALQHEEPESREIRRSIEIENLLTALMKLTPCTIQAPPDSLDALIKDCHLASQEICGIPCQPYIQDTIREVMRQYGPRYEFKVKDKAGSQLYGQGSCPGERLVDDYPIKAGQDFLIVELSLCP